METSKLLVGAAIMGLMAGSMSPAQAGKKQAQEENVLCKGANACAGKGGCGASKGKNSCKGHGNAVMTKAECDERGLESMQKMEESKKPKNG